LETETSRRRSLMAAATGAMIVFLCSVSPAEPRSAPIALEVVPSPHPAILVTVTVSAAPSGEIGTALLAGTATWYCGSSSTCTRGYGPSDLIAAVDPTLGIPKGTILTVRHEARSVTVRVVDICACSGRRIIDLSYGAFKRLADPSLGIIEISIEFGAIPTPPQTDTQGEP